MIDSKATLAVVLLLAATAAAAATPADPTSAEIAAAMTAWHKSAAVEGPAPKLTEVGACFPAHEQPDKLLCMVRVEGRDRYKPVPLQRQRGGFTVALDEDGEPDVFLDPACPPLAEAESFLRSAKRSGGLKVTGFGSDPFGDFTDERGKFREQKGPERLMCNYTMKTPLGSRLAITYVWRRDGAYVFEPEFEEWDDED
ncbi:MAG TPA: hypothetical protein VFS60_13470 [Thermoanaerobaculia bacterium]|nr:hypothetical protein [Thermoanaerobaculia bacterium]